MRNAFKFRAQMFGTTCVLALTVSAGVAIAQETGTTNGNYTININQALNGFAGETVIVQSGVDEDAIIAAQNVETSSAETDQNIASSTLTGNLASSLLTSDILNDDIGTGPAFVSAGTDFDGRERSEASANSATLSVVSAQNVNNAEATVSNVAAFGAASAEGVLTSSVDVTDNLAEGVGILNRNTATILSNANTTNVSSGVASSQNVTESSLAVSVSSFVGIEVDGVASTGSSADDSSIEVSGNQLRAVAAGNVGMSTISAEATAMDALASMGTATISLNPTDSLNAPTVTAASANAIASSQVIDLGADNAISAAVDGAARIAISVAEDVDASNLVNDGNSASALALGNEVNNRVALGATNAETGEIDPDDGSFVQGAGSAAAIGNLQILGGDVVATAMAGDAQGILTGIGDDVADSAVSTSDNTIAATATGNTGANTVTATATNIDTSGSAGAIATASNLLAGTSTTGAGFEVASYQGVTSGSSITATLADRDEGTGASVRTSIGGDIDDSTVKSVGNTLQAAATGNEITPQTNLIEVTGTNVATTTALANTQVLQGDVSAIIGAPGTPGVAPQMITVNGTSSGTAPNITFTGDVTDLSVAERNALLNQYGGSISGDTYTLPGQSFSGSELEFLFGGSDAIPGAGGVTIFSGSTISDSTVTVDSNTTRGTVTGNTATNTISVSATNLDAGSVLAASTATDSANGQAFGTAGAEHALANAQAFDSDLSTDVAGTFAILGDLVEYDTTDSTLSVSGNRQFATTRGNVVENGVSLSATNMDTGAALSSAQTNFLEVDVLGFPVDAGTVASASVMDVSAPLSMEQSSLALNTNRNEAVATVNTANNSMSVSTTNIDSISGGDNVALVSSLTTGGLASLGVADFVIGNAQFSGGTATASATTTVSNQEGLEFEDGVAFIANAGILNSLATADGNVTIAQSSANRANNTLTLSTGSELEATGGVLNTQISATEVTALATSSVGFVLDTAAGVTPLDNSTASVSGNVASAQANGNVSTNVLNASSLSLTSGDGLATANLNTGSVASTGLSASYGLLNNQNNTAGVSAGVNGTFGVDVSTAGLAGTSVLNSSGSVSGNSIQSAAAGNTATNTLVVSALNHGASTAALGNEQTNSGNIVSAATGMIGMAAFGGDVSGSSISVGGNTISSSAIGNTATSTLRRN